MFSIIKRRLIGLLFAFSFLFKDRSKIGKIATKSGFLDNGVITIKKHLVKYQQRFYLINDRERKGKGCPFQLMVLSLSFSSVIGSTGLGLINSSL